MSRSIRGAALALAPAALGCTPTPGDGGLCATGFLGDPSLPARLEILVVQPDDSVVPAVDGGAVALIEPPQGGRVVFAGARATNVEACGMQLTGALRNPSTEQVRPDQRTVDLVPTGDGWGVSAAGSAAGLFASFANIPVCPNQWSSVDVFGQPYLLEVAIQDRSGRTASATLVVTPYCGEPSNAAACMCTCATGYVLGQPCPQAPSGDAAEDGG